jgi:hypothetical protein
MATYSHTLSESAGKQTQHKSTRPLHQRFPSVQVKSGVCDHIGVGGKIFLETKLKKIFPFMCK